MSNIQISPTTKTDGILATNSANLADKAKYNGRTVTIATLNIDTSLPVETQYNKIFSEYTINNRMPGINIKLNHLKKQEAEIICIQEGRSCNASGITVDSVTPIVTFLENNGYNTAKVHYNNSGDKAFQFITAVDNSKFKVISNERILLSKDGQDYPNINKLSSAERKKHEKDIKKHYLDIPFPRFRSFLLTEARDIATNKQLFIANIHLNVCPESHKSKAITRTINKLTELHNDNPDSIIILAGDFNSFPDQGGIEQIKMLRDANFNELSKTVIHPNGEKFVGNSSFTAFPYDYAAYTTDATVATNVTQAKQILKEASTADDKENSTKLAEARSKWVETFQMVSQQAKDLWQQEENETNSKSLYPLGGQLDHIFVMAKDNTVATADTATIQIIDTHGNTLANDKEAIVEHIQNSLQEKVAPYATDHPGLVSSMTIL